MAPLRKVFKAFKLLKSPRYVRALWYSVAATVEHEKVLMHLQFSTIVDIGANRGQFSLLASTLFPDARIYAFEPLAVPAETFRKVFTGDNRATLFQAAIGPQSDRVDMYVSHNDASSSLLPITDLQTAVFPCTGASGTETVTVGPLDQFVGNESIIAPALLKLDVQGFELSALEGCTGYLQMFDNVYVECSFVELYLGQALAHEVIDYLHQHDFHLCGIYNIVYNVDGQAIQADFMFHRQMHFTPTASH